MVSVSSKQISKRFLDQRVLEEGGTAKILICYDAHGTDLNISSTFFLVKLTLFMQYSLSDKQLCLVKELRSAEHAFKETRTARITPHPNIVQPMVEPIYIEDMHIYWVTTPLGSIHRLCHFFRSIL